MILAKPVVANQFWILKQDNRKVGQLEVAENGNCTIRINDSVAQYKTIKMARQAANIEFEPPVKSHPAPANMVHGFEVSGRVYNPLWNVQLKLPLFTRDTKSKSWYAAGWYRVKQHRIWKVVQHPKLITLQRYPYAGPFHSQEQANDQSVS